MIHAARCAPGYAHVSVYCCDCGAHWIVEDRPVPVSLREAEGVLAEFGSNDAPSVIVFARVNPAPAARLSSLVGCIVVGRPLQIDVSAWAAINLHGICGNQMVVKAAGK